MSQSPEKHAGAAHPEAQQPSSQPEHEKQEASSLAGPASGSKPVPESATGGQRTKPGDTNACVCSCGKCCCHGNNEPKHCVRCHANYSFNHPDACWVPHIFDRAAGEEEIEASYDLVAPSVCCGNGVAYGEQRKSHFGNWQQPSPCVWGWHTTNVLDVEKKYNGINILRCLPGPDGKCTRKHLKYDGGGRRRRYKAVFDEHMQKGYVSRDEDDRQAFYKRIERKEGAQYLEDEYQVKLDTRKRKGEHHSDEGASESKYRKVRES